MSKDSVDSSRPPSEFDVPDSGHGDSSDALGSGQEENPGKVQERVCKALSALLVLASAIVYTYGNQAGAVEVDDKGQIARLNQDARNLSKKMGGEISEEEQEIRELELRIRQKCSSLAEKVKNNQSIPVNDRGFYNGCVEHNYL